MEKILNAALVLVGSEGIKVATKNIVDLFVKPKLEEVFKNTKNEKDLYRIENKLIEYLERSYDNNLYMNTIVFKNEQKTINDLYIPLTVRKSSLINNEDKVKICINKYKEDFIPKYKKILLVDNAGMGKSTLMKYLYLNAVNENKGIPVLIELRKFDKKIDLVDFIKNEINGIREVFSRELILMLIERGDFIFLFDGYDEIKEELKEYATKELEEFIDKAPKNEFVISSRDDSALSCFGDFQRFDIEPLSKDEAYSLIRKYDSNQEISKQLINLLENEDSLKIVTEFLDNPLMVSLLYLAFGYRRDLPNGKHIFYKQVYNALFLDHDRSKGSAYVHPKASNLNIDEFHKLLRILGFITLKEGISYSREKLLEWISIAKKQSFGLEFKESNFLHDLENIVALFTKEGGNYRWCHKSFQEYFAACYIYHDCKEKQKDILLKMCDINKIDQYYNVLDFYYDLDYNGFMETLIYPIVNDMEKFYSRAYNDEYFSKFNKDEINTRKSIQFRFNKIKIRKLTDEENEIIDKGEVNALECLAKDVKGNTHANLHIVPYRASVICINDSLGKLAMLLYKKNNNLVTEVKNKYKVDYENKNIFDILIDLDGGVYYIDDCINNILNEKEIFSRINVLLEHTAIGEFDSETTIIFDYDKCIEFKNRILPTINSQENMVDYI